MSTTEKSPDQRRAKGIESRQTIIDAAIKCIATRGLCDTTLDRVADMAKVSRALLVFHFKSKKGLLTAVLASISTDYDLGWQAIVAQANLSPSERLYKFMVYDAELPTNKPDLLSVWHSFWGEAKGLYKELGYAKDEAYEQDMEVLIQAMVDESNYPINARLLTQSIVAMSFGIWWNAHLKGSKTHLDDSMQTIDSFLKLCFPKHY
ncbi:MAG: AcrR family transcriptional regulator [Neolewinella sp.]|jgi:AcrR family transcriptional regulator